MAKKGNTHFQREFGDRAQKKKDDDGHIQEVTFKGHKLIFKSGVGKEVAEIRTEFCNNLLKNIENRFPRESVDVASAFHIFGMTPLLHLSQTDRQEFGQKELDILIDHYGNMNKAKKGEVVGKAVIDRIRCREELPLAKKLVLEQRYPMDPTKGLWKLLYLHHRDVLPNLMKLANLALIMPYQTADCERGFSCQNGITTARRNCLKEKHLNVLMTIKIEGGSPEYFDFGPAIQKWKGKKNRNIYKY